MANGDVVELIEIFLKEEGQELPPDTPKNHRYLMYAIKGVRKEFISEIKGIKSGMGKEVNDLSDIIRGEKKVNEEGSLIHEVKRNSRFVKGSVWVLGAVALAFLGTIGAAIAGKITFIP